MQPLTRGVYTARLATTMAEVEAAQTLRHVAFRRARGLSQKGSDADAFDTACRHVLVTHDRDGVVVCCFRVLDFMSGADIAESYAAQFYELSAFRSFAAPMLELGRFCLHPDHNDPDILRLAWAALTRLVDDGGVAMLFGCSSFDGADPAQHRTALAYLARNHLGPQALRPAAITPAQIALSPFAFEAPMVAPVLPSLLRTYLGMGGWVSDRAVIDHDLNTLHVFTGLDIAAVTPSRARALRVLAALPHAGS